MRTRDVFKLSLGSLIRYRMRTLMMLLAMAIGVSAVVTLTALAEGARRYVSGEFSSLGTNLLIVLPGRTETSGAGLALMAGETPRDLTIEDAMALLRSSAIDELAPIMVGSANVSFGGREREAPIMGSTAQLLSVRRWDMAQGQFLPSGDVRSASSVCVIGTKVRDELFGAIPAVGQWLRIGERRFRVIGVLASAGRTIMIDSDKLVIIPVAAAQALFNSQSLFRILISARSRDAMLRAKRDVRRIITDRHYGEEDVTVVTQDAVLKTFDSIFGALTATLAGIASISLAVAGVLIMNVMLVAVSQRTAEIGLLRAVGATRRQIIALFLTEAALLSLMGAMAGLALGQIAVWAMVKLFPILPAQAPDWAILASVLIAVGSGLVFGIMPARRAASLDPVQALAGR